MARVSATEAADDDLIVGVGYTVLVLLLGFVLSLTDGTDHGQQHHQTVRPLAKSSGP